MRQWQHSSVLLLSVIASHFLAVLPAKSADFYVPAGGSIQAAVDLAGDTDTVTLAAGTYNLTAGVDLGFRAITVRSESGKAVTVVNGQGSVRCFHLRNGLAKVVGLTIRNGKATASDNGYRYGGGVYCEGGGQVVDCIVENCEANFGGGIRIHTLGIVDNCIIRNNSSTLLSGFGAGGGIHAYLGGDVSDTLIYGNTAAGSGGGIKFREGGEIACSSVYNNTAAVYGGGIYCHNGGNAVECDVYGNTAAYGGGVRSFSQTGTAPEVRQCRIHNNSTTTGSGGGVQIAYGGLLENSLVYDNLAGANGGGISLREGGSVHSCTVAHNSTTDTDGNGAGDGFGGGIYTSGGGSIRNTIIFWNSSEATQNINTPGTGVSYEYCLTYPKPTGNGNIFGTPEFVDIASRNYYLKASSPCIDTGTSSGAPTEDFTGYRRPLDGKDDGVVDQEYDIGAYEYKETDDADRDGLPTYWELLYGLDPASTNGNDGANGDPDGDFLFNFEEYENGIYTGSNPQLQDTDGDGITDFDEVYGRYPSTALGFVTDPANTDTDGDGFGDKFEIDNDADPTDPNSYLTSLSGTVSYSGTLQPGGVVVLVSNTTVAVRTTSTPGLGAYTVTNVPTLEPLVVTAYRDSDGGGTNDPWEAHGEHAANPVTLTGPTTGIDIVLDDPTTDSDGDGLSDFFEVYTSMTLPDNEDTDGDTMWDGWEWAYRPVVNPTNGTDGVEDPDGDFLTNTFEHAAATDPGNPDSDGDLLPDGWEWSYRPFTNPTNGLDSSSDPDGDTLSNSNEYAIGTNPGSDDSDNDGMPDGWEAQYMPHLSPTNHDAASGYSTAPDYDLLSNFDEYEQGSDPTNLDSDGDGMIDGWEFHYASVLSLTNGTDGTNDPDSDGLTNVEEFDIWNGPLPFPPGVTWGPHPDVVDSDGDNVGDGDEIAAGTNPKDPDSYPVSIAGTLQAYSGMQSGVLYAVASQSPSGQVYRTSAITNDLTNAVSFLITDVAILTNYYIHAFMDSNANASQDVWEATGTFDGTNGAPLLIYLTNNYVNADITLADDPTLDSDLDTLTDLDEVYVYGTDPLRADTDGDSMPDWWEILYTNACDPNDPTDFDDDVEVDGPGVGDGLNNSNEFVNLTNPEVSDTDGDGLIDSYEVINGTKPNDADSDDDGLTDGEEVGVPLGSGTNTDPNNPDHDGDGTNDGDEVAAGSDPLDPDSFPASISGDLIYTNGLGGTLYAVATDGVGFWTNALSTLGPYAITNVPTLTNYTVSAYRDSDGDMMVDTWEAQGTYTNGAIWLTNSVTNVNIWLVHPTVDTDNDGLTDFDEVNVYFTSPSTNDTDGDSMPDGWEVRYPNALSPTNGADGAINYAGETNALGQIADDLLVNSNEFVWSTNPELWDTDGDSMPDGWEVMFSNAVNPTNGADGAEHFAGETNASGVAISDGLVNSNEYLWGTDPGLWDSDGDGVSDGDEVNAGSDPTNAASYLVSISGDVDYVGMQTGTVYAVAETGAAALSNGVAFAGTTGPYAFNNLDTLQSYVISAYRDSNGNGVRDTWEAYGAYTNNPIAQPTNSVSGVDVVLADPSDDTDGDGLTDYDEVYLYLTSPSTNDTDGDSMLDGWEVAYSNDVDALVVDALGDPDNDNLVNSNEHVAATDPGNPDTDGDSMWDGWEFAYPGAVNPTNPADAHLDVDQPEPDGLSNSNEYVWGTNPEAWDTDNDNMPDGWEVMFSAAVNPTNGADGAVDFSGETNALGIVELDGLANSNEFIWGTSPLLFDTDGDGAGDGREVDSGTDPTNATSKPISISGFLWNSTSPTVTGEVYVVLSLASNSNVFASYDVGPIGSSVLVYAVTNVPSRSNYWVSAFIDINSNSTYETWEPYGARASATPAENDATLVVIAIADSQLDTDGDGLTDYDEVFTYFTSPTNSDSDADSFTDSNEVRRVYRTDPNDINSFPASIGGLTSYSGSLVGPVWVVVTNSALAAVDGPYGVGAYATPTNYPTLTNYYVMAYIDENTNGVHDIWEPSGFADTYPIDLVGDVSDVNIAMSDPSVDSDGDGLTDYEEHFRYFTDPTTNDTDGDTMLDGWEVVYPNACDPNSPADAGVDYDSDGLTTLEEHDLVPQTNPEDDDSDDDGLTDGDEVNTHLTEPMNADTDGDGMPDGWEVTYIAMLDPLVWDAFDDPDSDGLWNRQEYEDSMTDPTLADTDAEGLSDFDEYVTYHTIPTNTDSDADGFDDYQEVIEIGSMATNAMDPYVVDDNAPGDPVAGNPNISNPNENGHLPTPAAPFNAPFDAIQEAVDSAQPGYTVLVLDGVYQGFMNRDIDPGGKAITIRSRNGYATTQIFDSSGGGFICSSGETTNTVIQGFTVRTRVVELGAAGVTCVAASPTIKECWFFDCGQAGVRCQSGANPLIVDCLFQENEGGIEIQDSSPMVTRSTMLLNRDANGAGLHISGTSEPHVVNCVIVQNVATNMGGGFYVGVDAEPIFVNCTVADNVASNAGGGFHNAGELHFWNAVLWGNAAPVGPGYHLLHSFESGYSCLQTLHLGGLNNIVSDPQFAGVGTYELKSTSPCVDAGIDQQSGVHAPEDDRDGRDRIAAGGSGHSKYDMGAYEYVPGGRIFVQTPGGTPGEVLGASIAASIEWTWESNVGTNIDLHYTFDFLSQTPIWHTIATNVFRGTNGMGSYAWSVPQTNTSRCYVRAVDSTNSQVEGVSPFEFAIVDAVVLYEPNGGQVFYLGQTGDVSWASSVTTNTAVDMVLSVDGSSFDALDGAVTVGSGVAHTGGGVTNQTTWVLATGDQSILTANGLLRVAYADGSLSDASDSSFEVRGLVVTQPGAGVGSVVVTGSVVNVNWDTVGAGAAVDVYLSTNAGASYAVLTNGISSSDGANTFAWTVGNTPTSNAVMRVQSVTDSNIVGRSGAFRISDGVTVFADVDGDGMSDEYEIAFGLDHQSPTGPNGAAGDLDGDGFINSSEMFAGTNPNDAGSRIGILSMTLQAAPESGPDGVQSGMPTFRFAAVDGREYRIEAAPSILGPWSDASGTLRAEADVVTWVDSSGAPSPRFYRVVVLSD
jgi:hypothetical protein